jgi:Flp pilus assembly protein TadG
MATCSSARRGETGASFIELALVLLPMMALTLAIVDFSMPIFLQSMFTSAVWEGCRSGITYTLTFNGTTYTSQTAEIKAVVQHLQNYAMGFLSGSNANLIKVKYFTPVSPFTQLTGTGANTPGNLLEVSVLGYSWNFIAPLWRSGNPLVLNAISADRLDALASGTMPPTP